MANPKCGTCHFFQENDLPGSGWCHHPQRKVSSDVKILVRRSELACRDDWSRSLWQPKLATSGSDIDAAPQAPTGPLLPASPESLRAVLNRDLTVSAAAGEDVLLSEGRIVSESAEPWEPPARPFLAGHFNPRTAIFKAREAYREKNRANAAAARHSVEAVTGAFEHASGESRHEEPDPGSPPESSSNDDVQEPGWNEPLAVEHDAAQSSEGVLGPSAVSSETELTVSEDEAIDASFWEFELPMPEATPGVPPSFQAGVCPAEASIPSADLAADIGAQQTSLATQLPVWFRADLPRVCRACRDFRPGADGQQGWCANAWAFTHRQIVREDDAAPCHSTIGDWWVPVDDVWLVAADVSSHGRPTPLLDRAAGIEDGRRRRS